MDCMHVPLFVTIDKAWRHSTDVRAGANKQENDEKKGLKVEQGGLRCGMVVVNQLPVRTNYEHKDRERARTMALFISYDQLLSCSRLRAGGGCGSVPVASERPKSGQRRRRKRPKASKQVSYVIKFIDVCRPVTYVRCRSLRTTGCARTVLWRWSCRASRTFRAWRTRAPYSANIYR
jgi:hypothetical protein